MNLRDFEKVRHRAGGVGSERIRSGDVSEALTEVLLEDIRFPPQSYSKDGRRVEGKKAADRPSSNSPTGSEGRDRPPKKAKTIGGDHKSSSSSDCVVAKSFHWQFSHAKDCPITEDPDSVAHLVRHFKPAGCPLPSLRNMLENDAYVKMVVAHAKANNEFAATLEERLKDVPRLDELQEIKKVVHELKFNLKMAQDRERASVTQLAAAEKLGDQTTSLEARLRVAEHERKSALD
ncbi:hypothetical protein Bca52824_018085 [Brassica carinata]|uniref:Uncharacterized protein n=1 Tax=Brassica carinata TaxID=52824 RepID=A0A8X8AY61_BRACI|nr:hypothetical protein Bca52824_018085 [Brassica carinata]